MCFAEGGWGYNFNKGVCNPSKDKKSPSLSGLNPHPLALVVQVRIHAQHLVNVNLTH